MSGSDLGDFVDTSLARQCVWEPKRFLRKAANLDEETFLKALDVSPVLLVHLPPELSSLRTMLAAMSPLLEGGAGRAAYDMAYRTRHPTGGKPRQTGQLGTPPPADQRSLPGGMRPGSYFIVAPRKRDPAQPGHRVSVGRATNMDIVLRHQSVSKFHAWLYCNPDEEFSVRDAGSTNGTWINRVEVGNDERSAIKHGDLINFGDIEVHACDPSILWKAIRA